MTQYYFCGDFSWAMHLKDTYKDFEYLNSMCGKKILLKGNHDYWWNSLKKMEQYLDENSFNNISFLYNNSYECEGYIIAGTRGWSNLTNTSTADDEKILKRETLRLELSIQDGINKYGSDKEIIICMHYPPFAKRQNGIDFVEIMKKYNVKKCLYGHLHGSSHKDAVEGVIDGIEFKCLSCDYTDFRLVNVSE